MKNAFCLNKIKACLHNNKYIIKIDKNLLINDKIHVKIKLIINK